ncbi:MAG: amidase, partial [Acidimicrobiales bacterium]
MRTVIEIAESVRRGERKAAEVLDECLDAIEARNGALNAFVHLDVDQARSAADLVDAAVARGEDPGPLAGVPMGVKDLEDCAGMPTSHGSLLYKGRPPVAEDSVHVGRLRAAGAIPVGKTAAPEFGVTCFTDTKAWGTTRNPWDLTKTPGGSSGGSAAAVAAGLVPFCTASDGGGSTRIPAAFSGLLGFKASYGRIPHPSLSPSMTTSVGALTTTVADAARHLDVAAGPDDRDKVSLPAPTVTYERAIEELETRGLRVAWSPDLGFATVEPEVANLAFAAAERLADAASLEWVERPIQL